MVLALAWWAWAGIALAVVLLALFVLAIACYPRDNSF